MKAALLRYVDFRLLCELRLLADWSMSNGSNVVLFAEFLHALVMRLRSLAACSERIRMEQMIATQIRKTDSSSASCIGPVLTGLR